MRIKTNNTQYAVDDEQLSSVVGGIERLLMEITEPSVLYEMTREYVLDKLNAWLLANPTTDDDTIKARKLEWIDEFQTDWSENEHEAYSKYVDQYGLQI